MIRFLENHSLKSYNTFGVDALAGYFFELTDPMDLMVFLQSNKTWKDEKIFILGGGSNVLFTGDFNGLVIHPNVPGINIVKEDPWNVWLEAGAGVEWDEFVGYCVSCGFGGLENLSLIPGKVGAAPVQNIGAYGREVCDLIESVSGFTLISAEQATLTAEQCNFAYRDSIFKKELKDKFIITSVLFKLDKYPEFVLDYSGLESEVRKLGEVSLINIRQAVINIRSAKLPDTKKIGNAGSFFKNPVVEVAIADGLKSRYPDMPLYAVDKDKSKLAAGWLIEQCGWKGFRDGDAGVHDRQALVLVNHGNASGNEIYNLSEKIRKSVFDKFGIDLAHEVNLI